MGWVDTASLAPGLHNNGQPDASGQWVKLPGGPPRRMYNHDQFGEKFRYFHPGFGRSDGSYRTCADAGYGPVGSRGGDPSRTEQHQRFGPVEFFDESK